MLTKMLVALVLSGAALVAGDAAYRNFDCCSQVPQVSSPQSPCCATAAKEKKSDCCSTKSDCCNPVSECCVGVKGNVASKTAACCNAAYVYCTITGEVYEGCCCEMVDGKHRCLITGTVSDECCCIPIE